MLTDTTIRLVSQPIARPAMEVAGPKVVVVEDDESMRRAIERLLDVAGFHIAAYPSAEAVLADRADEAATCVVSDLKLPGMSGLDLLAELRARRRSPGCLY